MKEALADNSWTNDIVGGLPVVAVGQALQLLDIIAQTALTEQDDQHIWTPAASGQFSTKSAYERQFIIGIKFEPYRRLWKTWAPLKVVHLAGGVE